MKNTVSMCRLEDGARCRVSRLMNRGSIRRRLQDIGLIEGTEVLCLNRSPSGDPAAYFIRGAVIAIRDEDASKIIVERI
ncbi:MAG: ferrous iron transport protein A [Oscillospiraceae bacterium]|nr:ferrous iron transport protein A [Oscillospiraceae bacterium]